MASLVRVGDRNCSSGMSLSVFRICQFNNDRVRSEQADRSTKAITGSIITLHITRVSKHGSLMLSRNWEDSRLWCTDKYVIELRIGDSGGCSVSSSTLRNVQWSSCGFRRRSSKQSEDVMDSRDMCVTVFHWIPMLVNIVKSPFLHGRISTVFKHGVGGKESTTPIDM